MSPNPTERLLKVSLLQGLPAEHGVLALNTFGIE